MSDISPINSSVAHSAGRIDRASKTSNDTSSMPTHRTEDVRGRGGARPNDQVEFSHIAKYLSQLQKEPTQSNELINRVRTQIDSGTYLTEEKLSTAADEMIDDIL